jgi:hypothetical protein
LVTTTGSTTGELFNGERQALLQRASRWRTVTGLAVEAGFGATSNERGDGRRRLFFNALFNAEGPPLVGGVSSFCGGGGEKDEAGAF